MKNHLLIFTFLLFYSATLCSQNQASAFQAAEIARWEKQAKNIEIIRDNWGIPHVYGKTDADAVFGMLYVQCEDDFHRLEHNYIDALGKMSAAFGKEYLYHDLRAAMFMNEARAKQYYNESPAWLKKLCDAFADGINYYLHTHPEVKPKLLTRFHNWMPFYFSEGSIGGDITRISLKGMESFYGQEQLSFIDPSWALAEAPTGSNGFAIHPSKSATGNSLFLINPHTSYYFRSELHVNSEEGLKAYGAVTWGQFFIYQGFNEYCGWMHTSTYADAIDQYEETIKKEGSRYFYKYGKAWRPVSEKTVSIDYKEGGQLKQKDFTFYSTHHGPVIRKEGDKWITFRMMERPKDALRQSFLRTKAKGFKQFKKTMKIRTNSSNNTVYADYQGNIAYWHGNFIPKRNPNYDYNGLIDGSNPQTDWKGLHKLGQMVFSKNPKSGWVQNCNATPFTVAGNHSPKRSDYATYIAPDKENYRGINAVRVLSRTNTYTLETLREAANDPYLAAFESLIPDLVSTFERAGDQNNGTMKMVIQTLKDWDFKYGEQSVGTALAIYWGEALGKQMAKPALVKERRKMMMADYLIKYASDQEKLAALEAAINKLDADFGSWNTPWGEIMRFQRLTGEVQEQYDDSKASIPIGFASGRWGSLASVYEDRKANTKRRYGRGGNSFVALVEFGKKLKAFSIVSGGQSSEPDSPHFTDQAKLFCKGEFKTVHYYKEDVLKNKERSYRPGE
jgi:acyl-homoserine lactone acylase PvdQ